MKWNTFESIKFSLIPSLQQLDDTIHAISRTQALILPSSQISIAILALTHHFLLPLIAALWIQTLNSSVTTLQIIVVVPELSGWPHVFISRLINLRWQGHRVLIRCLAIILIVATANIFIPLLRLILIECGGEVSRLLLYLLWAVFVP